MTRSTTTMNSGSSTSNASSVAIIIVIVMFLLVYQVTFSSIRISSLTSMAMTTVVTVAGGSDNDNRAIIKDRQVLYYLRQLKYYNLTKSYQHTLKLFTNWETSRQILQQKLKLMKQMLQNNNGNYNDYNNDSLNTTTALNYTFYNPNNVDNYFYKAYTGSSGMIPKMLNTKYTYVHVWKSGGTTIDKQIRVIDTLKQRQIIKHELESNKLNELKDSKKMKKFPKSKMTSLNDRYIHKQARIIAAARRIAGNDNDNDSDSSNSNSNSGDVLFTFIRDPIEHFISGYKECQMRWYNKGGRSKQQPKQKHQKQGQQQSDNDQIQKLQNYINMIISNTHIKHIDSISCIVHSYPQINFLLTNVLKTGSNKKQQVKQQKPTYSSMKISSNSTIMSIMKQKQRYEKWFNSNWSLLPNMKFVADITEMELIFKYILHIPYNPTIIGRNATTTKMKQKLFTSATSSIGGGNIGNGNNNTHMDIDILTKENLQLYAPSLLQQICNYVLLDYVVFDFDYGNGNDICTG